MVATLDRFGRIVVPKEIRDRHALVPGSQLEIDDSEEAITLRVRSDDPGLVERDGLLVFRARTTGDLSAGIRTVREERIRRSGTWHG